MRQRITTVVAIVTALLFSIASTTASPAPTASTAPAPVPKVDALLQRAVAADPPSVRVIATTVGSPDAAADAAERLGATVSWRYSIIDGFAATVPTAAVAELAARDDVLRVWLDRPVKPLMDISHKAIGADRAWAAGTEGAGITVAVLDSGADISNPDLSPAIVRCVSTIGGAVTPECTDSDGHGTHVAGTVASRDAKYPGIARKANLAIVRVLHAAGSGFNSDIVAGMQWIAANKNAVTPPIKVATMSIGYLDPGCGTDSNPDAQAANALVSAGIVFTVAAGNSGHAQCTIDGSSAASKVISVAAVDDRSTVAQGDDVIASFSSGGSPSNGKPDVSFPGVAITSTFPGAGLLVSTSSGTSMATPHAAGTAALLLSREPALTAQQVKDRINGTALKTNATGASFNYVYGNGLGNACRALLLSAC